MSTSVRGLLNERTRTTRNDLLRRRDAWRPSAPPSGVTWLFVATLPNSGSTVLSRLLTTSPQVFTLEGRGEAQWLVPQMSAKVTRWDPDHLLDYDLVRAVWLHRARRLAAGRSVLVEKSPSNIVRMGPLLDAFADTDRRLVVFTREPLAVCAGWARRKTPEVLLEWAPPGTALPKDDEAFYTLIGQLCGRRMAYLAPMLERESLQVTYEEMTGSTKAFTQRLASFVPELGAMDTTATMRGVKDYPEQQLRDMNAEQVARLTPQQLSWLRAALEPWATTLERLGYSL